jgi:hypothetical protein
METFDPSGPAIVHDAVKDEIIAWDWEWADAFRREATYDHEGRAIWNGMVLDGWGEALGG